MRRVSPLIIAVSIAGAVYGSAAGLGLEDGHGPGYWLSHSLVYARVDTIKEGPVGGGMTVAEANAVIRPMGVLSGLFDAGSAPTVAVRLLRDADGAPFPAIGDGILLVMVDQRHPRGRPLAANGYAASDNLIAYLPTPNSQFSVVKEFSDPAVAGALKEVQKLRRAEKSQRAYDPCLVYGDIRAVWRDQYSGPDAVVVRPKDALSGAFDAANDVEVATDSAFLKHNFFAIGANVVVWFRSRARSDGGSREYSIPLGPSSSIPPGCSPICKVTGPGDPKVAALLAMFRRCTFWETHSLVYAEIVETRSPKDNKGPGTVILRPKLALSGQFDPAKTPEITAPTDAKILESQFHVLYAGGMVLAVLTRSGDSYSITADPTPFMPAGHGPICLAKNLEDRTVQDTLAAVQKLRHASDETKPKSEPAKR